MANPFSAHERTQKFYDGATPHAHIPPVDFANFKSLQLGAADKGTANPHIPKLELTDNAQNDADKACPTDKADDAKPDKADKAPPADESDDAKTDKNKAAPTDKGDGEQGDKTDKGSESQGNNSGDSKSDSGSQKKGKSSNDDDAYSKPYQTDTNSDGSTTEHYLDGHTLTKYPDGHTKWQNKPGNYIDSVESSADGSTIKYKCVDGITVTQNMRTGETTFTDENGKFTKYKDNKLVSSGTTPPEEKP